MFGNLEWSTRSENQIHAYKNGLQKPSQKQKEVTRQFNKKKFSKKVLQINLQDKIIKEWSSTKEAAKTLNISQGHISSCCNGNRKTTGGFKWKYKNF